MNKPLERMTTDELRKMRDRAKAEPVNLTVQQVAFFMERFRREEKLLGPHEQAALDYVIKMLDYKEADPKVVLPPTANDQEQASMYRFIRSMHWSDSPMAVVMKPKEAVRLGYYCPSGDLLDAEIQKLMGEKT